MAGIVPSHQSQFEIPALLHTSQRPQVHQQHFPQPSLVYQQPLPIQPVVVPAPPPPRPISEDHETPLGSTQSVPKMPPVIIQVSSKPEYRYVSFKNPTKSWEICDHITMNISPEEIHKQIRRHDEFGHDLPTVISRLHKHKQRHLRMYEERLNQKETDRKHWTWVISSVWEDKKSSKAPFWAIFSRISKKSKGKAAAAAPMYGICQIDIPTIPAPPPPREVVVSTPSLPPSTVTSGSRPHSWAPESSQITTLSGQPLSVEAYLEPPSPLGSASFNESTPHLPQTFRQHQNPVPSVGSAVQLRITGSRQEQASAKKYTRPIPVPQKKEYKRPIPTPNTTSLQRSSSAASVPRSPRRNERYEHGNYTSDFQTRLTMKIGQVDGRVNCLPA